MGRLAIRSVSSPRILPLGSIKSGIPPQKPNIALIISTIITAFNALECNLLHIFCNDHKNNTFSHLSDSHYNILDKRARLDSKASDMGRSIYDFDIYLIINYSNPIYQNLHVSTLSIFDALNTTEQTRC